MNQRSSLDTADWHEPEEQRFGQCVATAMERLVRERNINGAEIEKHLVA